MSNAQDLFNAYRERSAKKLMLESQNRLIEIPAIPEGTDKKLIPVGTLVKLRNYDRAPIYDFDSVWVVAVAMKENNWNSYILRKQGSKKNFSITFKQQDLIII